jgi:hypothetical protein
MKGKVMNMTSRLKAFKIGAFALLVASTSLVGTSHSFAADVPTVKLISPVISGTNSLDRTLEDLQIPAQKWYREGSRSIVITSPEGQELTLKFLVTKDGKTPWAGQDLTLLVGAPYSGSTGSWLVNGSTVGPQAGDWSETYAGLATAKTDGDGIATFTFTNKNSGSKFTSADVLSGFFIFKGNKDRFYTQFKPMIAGLKDYDEPYLIKDIVSVDLVKDSMVAPTPTASPTATATPKPTPVAPKANPSIRLTSPAYTSANSVDSTADIAQYYSPGTKAFYTYIAAGSTVSLTYHATLDGTTPAANKQIELYVDSAYSGSKANWVSGSTKIAAPAANDATFGAKLVGTTDANGDVTFKITNTDTKNLESAPATPNQDRGAIKPARLFGTIKPMFAGETSDKAEDTDLVTFDIYAGAKATTNITCVKGKLSKKVSGAKPVCPKGYTQKK